MAEEKQGTLVIDGLRVTGNVIFRQNGIIASLSCFDAQGIKTGQLGKITVENDDQPGQWLVMHIKVEINKTIILLQKYT